ncbi:lytic murein transglycosylase [Aliiglaciecola litoralis]|uniref:Lytic murein transglycosylase n=1 Tax=Aliiglaciecola litoralis TaxID=582857 RepID=A0ABN1LGI2_9ALTE
MCIKHSGLKAPIVATLTLLAMSHNAMSQEGQLEANFAQCVAQIEQQANAAGISSQVIEHALGDVTKIDKVLEYDRNQPEFVQTFPAYLNKRVTPWRIDKGREMLAKHQDLLARLTQQYGVPAHYLVAFWGLETNFGNYKGKMPIIDSLATLACDPRRSQFFTQELLVALQLMQREQLDKSKMLGSWAGAMGHTQFMPSAYLNYAVDGDGDSKVDLWDSEADALSSAANFLNQLGWQSGFIWGREVLLPDSLDYALAGKDQRKSLSQWSQLGLTRTNHSPLPESEVDASLILPTGAKGPAFLVYKNFDVIMRWNNSESYALAVGYLADLLIGKAPWHTPLPDLKSYPISQMKDLQTNLNALGFDVGEADGIAGPATRKGIRAFQKSVDLTADGYPSPEVFAAVQKAIEVPQNESDIK